MAHVDVTVNGRKYKMGCRAGQERRVMELAERVEGIVQSIKGGAKLIPDDRLFLMAALVVADQLAETQDELQRALKFMSDTRAYHVIDGGNASAAATRELRAEPALKPEGGRANRAV